MDLSVFLVRGGRIPRAIFRAQLVMLSRLRVNWIDPGASHLGVGRGGLP